MHCFHQSRGRILFEVLCALVISASFVGAWMQTGASALLPAAGVAALYGLVHLFDLRRRSAANAVESQRIEFDAEELQRPVGPTVDAEPQLAESSEQMERLEPAPPQRKTSRAKARPKGGGRRASSPEKAKVVELASSEVNVSELAPSVETEAFVPMAPEEAAHPHFEPLFEPDPFVRMPRRAFGRKAG